MGGGPITELQGTRVLDKFMMLKGAKTYKDQTWATNFVSVCDGLLKLLPDAWRKEVEDVAERADNCIDPARLSDFLPKT